jgi:hypothetical protein
MRTQSRVAGYSGPLATPCAALRFTPACTSVGGDVHVAMPFCSTPSGLRPTFAVAASCGHPTKQTPPMCFVCVTASCCRCVSADRAPVGSWPRSGFVEVTNSQKPKAR